jgi:putative Holliday junction resolvase
MRILGIDYGDVRVGVAVSDPLGFTAQGLETIQNRSKKFVLESLVKICSEYQVGEVVIGLPINMNGTMGPRAKGVMDLVPELEAALKVPVKTWDERLSSRQVERFMLEGGLSRQKRKDNSDRLAATLILQTYMESKR